MNRLLVCLVSILAVSAAAGSDFEKGLAAYKAGDYATAYREWLPLAEGGSTAAQFNLGLLHDEGKGVEADPTEAAKWYLKAADGGFARAQYRIAEMYERGEGVERDLPRAHQWYSLAGSQDYSDAKKRRKRLAKKMTSTEIAYAEMYARQWKRKRKERRKEAE